MPDVKATSSGAAMAVAASALRAQQSRMRVIAENLANANSVAQVKGGDPYRRQVPVFTTQHLGNGVDGVTMSRVLPDNTDFKSEYDPGAYIYVLVTLPDIRFCLSICRTAVGSVWLRIRVTSAAGSTTWFPCLGTGARVQCHYHECE